MIYVYLNFLISNVINQYIIKIISEHFSVFSAITKADPTQQRRKREPSIKTLRSLYFGYPTYKSIFLIL